MAVGVILGMMAFALLAAVALSPDLRRVEIGGDAPDFEAVNVVTGDTVGIDAFEGEVILLNIWATWCAPCEAEMPSMQRLFDELGPDGLRVVTVSIDTGDPDKVREWIDERELTFTVLHDRTGDIEQLYQTTGVPESFIIDRHGVIMKKIIGATEWDHPTQGALFRRLLAGE